MEGLKGVDFPFFPTRFREGSSVVRQDMKARIYCHN